MSSYRDSRTQPSAAQQIFGKVYVPQIVDMVLKEYGSSYATYSDDLNTWRLNIEYKPEIEKHIITETRMFILFLDQHTKSCKDPAFLKAFITCVSDYLSKYTMKNPMVSNQTRKQAKNQLMKKLWDEFPYIQGILMHQLAKREAKKERNIRYMNQQRRDVTKNEKAAMAYKKAKDMRANRMSGNNQNQK